MQARSAIRRLYLGQVGRGRIVVPLSQQGILTWQENAQVASKRPKTTTGSDRHPPMSVNGLRRENINPANLL